MAETKPSTELTDEQKYEQFWRTVAKSGKVYGHPDTIAEWTEKFSTAQSTSASSVWPSLGSIEVITSTALPKDALYALSPAPSLFFRPFKLGDFNLARSAQVRMATDQEPQREKAQASGLEVESGRGRDGEGAEGREDQGEQNADQREHDAESS